MNVIIQFSSSTRLISIRLCFNRKRDNIWQGKLGREKRIEVNATLTFPNKSSRKPNFLMSSSTTFKLLLGIAFTRPQWSA